MHSAASSLAAQTETALLRFAGQNFEPLPSGGLYWPAQDALLVADLHFEKMASFARRGQMLPPYDTGLTLTRLEADLRRTGRGACFRLVTASTAPTQPTGSIPRTGCGSMRSPRPSSASGFRGTTIRGRTPSGAPASPNSSSAGSCSRTNRGGARRAS